MTHRPAPDSVAAAERAGGRRQHRERGCVCLCRWLDGLDESGRSSWGQARCVLPFSRPTPSPAVARKAFARTERRPGGSFLPRGTTKAPARAQQPANTASTRRIGDCICCRAVWVWGWWDGFVRFWISIDRRSTDQKVPKRSRRIDQRPCSRWALFVVLRFMRTLGCVSRARFRSIGWGYWVDRGSRVQP